MAKQSRRQRGSGVGEAWKRSLLTRNATLCFTPLCPGSAVHLPRIPESGFHDRVRAVVGQGSPARASCVCRETRRVRRAGTWCDGRG